MTELVGHFLIFTAVAVVFLLIPLLLGKFLRPRLPTPEKDAIYECGEPTIGTSYIQFDLRFYVVALLFIIFDVEVAFFFPWAMVFGTATQLSDPRVSDTARMALTERMADLPGVSLGTDAAWQLAVVGLVDILIFFGVLLVGFAYVWKRGDLDWVRAYTQKPSTTLRPHLTIPPPPALERSREPEPAGVD